MNLRFGSTPTGMPSPLALWQERGSWISPAAKDMAARHLQRAGAKHVIGVDISEEVCLHARRKYGLDARSGSAERIPLPDSSVDVVVSFETIEHVSDPNSFLDECVQVLVPEWDADYFDS